MNDAIGPSRRKLMSAPCRRLEHQRTCRGHLDSVENDPKETSAGPPCSAVRQHGLPRKATNAVTISANDHSGTAARKRSLQALNTFIVPGGVRTFSPRR